MSIKDWVFGERRCCGYRRCGAEFIDVDGRKGQRMLYCTPRHQNAERQAVWRDKQRGRAARPYAA